MSVEQITTDDNRDCCADKLIQDCFDLKNPKSFFLFAGAGSGKTRSLVTALDYINSSIGRELRLNGKKVAVITYTNAARDEINRRIKYNSLFIISTIHSFAWDMISSHTADLKGFLKTDISNRIVKETQNQSASRNTTTQTYKDREKKIAGYKQRLEFLDSVKRFIYNPDGVNTENNSLDHAEVIKLCVELLRQKETLQHILIDKYPILLIDESQDTKRDLIDVLLQIQNTYSDQFTVGLLGDTMQRIYLDGKEDLLTSIPDEWKKPSKVMNHRSQKRIVDLCNIIRKDIDGIQQQAREDKPNGVVRLFLTSSSNPSATELDVLDKMAKIESDDKWLQSEEVKCLTIEHQMAAKRLGFSSFFKPLNNISSYKQGLMKGTLSAIGLFTHILIPLHKADMENNQFEKMQIIKENSLLFQEKDSYLTPDTLNQLNESIAAITLCWHDNDPTCKELLDIVYSRNIFPLAKDIKTLLENPPSRESEDYDKFDNLNAALDSKLSEVEGYYTYIMGNANFDTHQGVKGLEFEKVMVIIDDNASKGNTFSYNKLFEIEKKSATDIRNEKEGKETTLNRTKRLLYVTCSRAKSSLAIVYYTPNVDVAYQAILNTGWFSKGEIIKL